MPLLLALLPSLLSGGCARDLERFDLDLDVPIAEASAVRVAEVVEVAPVVVPDVARPALERAPAPSPRLPVRVDEQAVRVAVAASAEAAGRQVAITLDRPLVRPGETVWVRVWDLARGALDAMEPADVVLTLLDARGSSVVGARLQGAGAGAATGLEVPSGAAGGLYTLRATVGRTTAERPFVVAAFEEPRIRKELELLRDAYGPGDEVVAALQVHSAGAGPLVDHPLKVVVQVEGQAHEVLEARTDARGEATLRFSLPTEMQRPDAVLTVLVEEHGWTESVSREIPVVLDRVRLEWFPEGGDLIAGLPSRVYVRARDAHGEPADAAGEVFDQDGIRVAMFRTTHDGLGRFELTPEPGQAYRATLVEPAGVTTTSRLPRARRRGCVLRTYDDHDGATPELRVGVRCSEERRVLVTGSLRGRHLETVSVEAGPRRPAVAHLRARRGGDVQGVARVTVLSPDLEPLAERLVYRNRHEHLQIDVQPQRTRYGPRDEVVLRVTTRDPSGEPVAADVSLAVVDDRLLTHANDEHGHLLTQLHLAPWIAGTLEDPGWYFDPDEAEAGAGLDLVLGTHGWRRFARRAVLARAEASDRARAKREQGSVGMEESALARAGAAPVAPDGELASLGHQASGAGGLLGSKVPGAIGAVSGDAIVVGALDRSLIDEVIRRHLNAIRYCYQRELSKRPALGGKLVVKFTIGPGGAVRAASIKSSTLGNEAVERCVIGRFMRMEFPGPSGSGIVIVSYPLRFEPGAGGAAPLPAPPAVTYATVRVFAGPDYRGQPAPSARSDFRSTVFWTPSLQTGADGRATARFSLSDSVTTFRITAEGVGAGHVGRAERELHSTLPVALDVPLPTEVSFGDRLLVPIRLRNHRAEALSVALTTEVSAPLEPEDGTGTQLLTVPAGGGFTTEVPVAVPDAIGRAHVQVSAEVAGLTDAVSRTLEVAPRGFPHRWSAGGTLDGPGRHTVVIDDALPGGTVGAVTLYPSDLSSLMDGMASMVRIPGGCFEQTSSTNYPNVLVLRHLDRSGHAAGLRVDRTEALRAGYARLAGYQVGSGGFETFGRGPGKEALSAYGLLQFTDMRAVFPEVSPELLSRDAAYLLEARDGRGGFASSGASWHKWGAAPRDISDAFITWSLLETGQLGDGPEAQRSRELAAGSRDPYRLAVAALGLQHVDAGAAARAVERLVALQSEDGSFPGAETSVVRSGGAQLVVETTALATLALHRGGAHAGEVRRGAQWLVQARRGAGGWGSTQATVMALKALDALSASGQAEVAGSARIRVDGELVDIVRWSGSETAGVTVDLGPYLTPGPHAIDVVQATGEAIPYAVEATWRRETPVTVDGAPLTLETELASARVGVGETVRLTATVANARSADVASPTARIGLPAGVRAETWQLEALRDRGVIASFETRPREVTLYWEGFGPEEGRTVHLDLVAEIPGRFTAPASSAYPYYDGDAVTWAAGPRLDIAP